MSLATMMTELRGAVPKIPISYCKTLVNRAYGDLRRQNLWSFQLFQGQWIAPPQLTGPTNGTCTVTQGSATVTFDATAKAAINALAASQPYSLITQRQFRVASSGIYSIWAYDSATGIATLDRWFGESSATSSQFSIYQAYYVPVVANSPITDFRSWIAVRDMANFTDLFTERYDQRTINALDPQRTWYGIPTDVIPFADDANPASPSYGALQFELWGGPLFNVNYQLYGIRNGADLSRPADVLPFAVGEDCVLARARNYAYEWAEANKDITPRAQGPDFKFLMGKSQKEYSDLFRKYRQLDRDRVDNWFSVRRSAIGNRGGPLYHSQAGVAAPGLGNAQW